MKKAAVRDLVNRSTIRVGILIFAVIVLVLVIISPLALQQLTRIHGINWLRLSNVGQTYGAVSALLTALALGGVVISLLYQAREIRTAREQTSRMFHHELIKIEMENPIYMEVLGFPRGDSPQEGDYDSLRQYDFVHMWVSYWEGQYALRELPEAQIRFIAANELFNRAVGRRYWAAVRDPRLKLNTGRRLQFSKVLDDEYNKAIASGPPVTTSLRNNSRKRVTTSSLNWTRLEAMPLS